MLQCLAISNVTFLEQRCALKQKKHIFRFVVEKDSLNQKLLTWNKPEII